MKRAGLLMSVVAGIAASVVPGISDLRHQGYNVRVPKQRNPEVEAAAKRSKK